MSAASIELRTGDTRMTQSPAARHHVARTHHPVGSPIMRHLLSVVLLCGLCLLARPASTQDAQPGEPYSPAVLRGELAHLYESLQSAHVNLFVHRTKSEYDERFNASLRAIDRPMRRLDVVRLFMPFVAYGRIGHAKIDFPIQDYIAYYQAGGILLPLDIAFRDGRPLLAHAYVDHPALVPGREVLRINERPIADWLDRTGRFVSAERPYMVNAQLESMFPRLMWLSEGRVDQYSVTLQTEDGAQATVELQPKSVAVIEEAKAAREAEAHRRTARMLDDSTAYLRPGPFYAAGGEESLESVVAFYDTAFADFIAAGAQDLIVDLRNNPGGDNSFSDPMIAWFADRPFRFASRYVLKASPETRRVLDELATRYPDGVSAQMQAAMQAHDDGERFEFKIPKVSPRSGKRFTGRVWALINRHSYSNATTVAAIIQDNGFGTLVGEQTADLPTSYASSAQFTLPVTGLAVTYPKGYFVRPSGDTALRGVQPDIPLPPPALSQPGDGVLDALRQHIAKQAR